MIEEKASLSGFDDPCSRHSMSFWGMFGRRGRISVGKDQRLRIDCRLSRGNVAAAAGSVCPCGGSEHGFLSRLDWQKQKRWRRCLNDKSGISKCPPFTRTVIADVIMTLSFRADDGLYRYRRPRCLRRPRLKLETGEGVVEKATGSPFAASINIIPPVNISCHSSADFPESSQLTLPAERLLILRLLSTISRLGIASPRPTSPHSSP
jgi:hypothetical protein